MTETTSKVQTFKDYAAQCNGSEQFYRHFLARRLIYSDGAKFLADTLGAHWLIDAIASYVATTKRVQLEEFQVWILHAKEGLAVSLVMTNGNDHNAIVAQEIEYSDFPRELLPLRLYVEKGGDDWTLMLPEER